MLQKVKQLLFPSSPLSLYLSLSVLESRRAGGEELSARPAPATAGALEPTTACALPDPIYHCGPQL